MKPSPCCVAKWEFTFSQAQAWGSTWNHQEYVPSGSLLSPVGQGTMPQSEECLGHPLPMSHAAKSSAEPQILSSSSAVRGCQERQADSGAVPTVTLWHAATDQHSQVDITYVTSASMSWHPSRNWPHSASQKKIKMFLHLASPYGATIKGDEGFITAAAEWQLSEY